VKTTRYFDHVRKRPDRATIRDEWIVHVLEHPEKTEMQSDGRVRKWAHVAKIGKAVHNAFFDRSFTKDDQ
jgi:hypothetical protein